jgi:hypothetical protein
MTESALLGPATVEIADDDREDEDGDDCETS